MIEDVVKKTKNTGLRAHLFNTTVLPALTYASKTWALREQDENAVNVIKRSTEKVMLGVTPHASEGGNTKFHPTSTDEDQGRYRVCQVE
ncbi:hypothetical protein Y032_0059g3046 [Ancylostoma ceylanicum]|uniref:Uncharacterized protein n=1 Tax=Ancylostoma ceylanicum TaxID=53326 RepID=A0A016U464_9BILA|nr:hypothetical protein Y032_0059g3046 [Ancylostoma ceylanicum]